MKRFSVRLLLTLCLSMATLGGMAQKPFVVDLWPDGLPNTNGHEQEGYDDAKRNYKPSMEVHYIEKGAPHRAVLVCPGGAYYFVDKDKEANHWAPFFRNMDVATFVLKYRMPHGHDEVPLSDAYQALRIIKAHAKEWNIDPDQIGIMGSSAGGHLASTVATHAPDDILPAFQILFYPVISMDPAITHEGSRNNLITSKPSPEKVKYYSNELQVTDKTPRAFMALSDDDYAVPPANSIRYYTALKEHKIPASLHIYPSGVHGWGIAEYFRFHTEMELELKAWLRTF